MRDNTPKTVAEAIARKNTSANGCFHDIGCLWAAIGAAIVLWALTGFPHFWS